MSSDREISTDMSTSAMISEPFLRMRITTMLCSFAWLPVQISPPSLFRRGRCVFLLWIFFKKAENYDSVSTLKMRLCDYSAVSSYRNITFALKCSRNKAIDADFLGERTARFLLCKPWMCINVSVQNQDQGFIWM